MATPLVSSYGIRRNSGTVSPHTRLPSSKPLSRPTSPRCSSSPLVQTVSAYTAPYLAAVAMNEFETTFTTVAANVAAFSPLMMDNGWIDNSQYNWLPSVPTSNAISTANVERAYGYSVPTTLDTYTTTLPSQNNVTAYEPLNTNFWTEEPLFSTSIHGGYASSDSSSGYSLPGPTSMPAVASVFPADVVTASPVAGDFPVFKEEFGSFDSSSGSSPTSPVNSQDFGSQVKTGRVTKTKAKKTKRSKFPGQDIWKVRSQNVTPEGTFQTLMPPRPNRPQDGRSKEITKKNRELGACEYHRRQKKECDRRWDGYIFCAKPQLSEETFLSNFLSKPITIRLFRNGPNKEHANYCSRPELYALEDLDSAALEYHGLKEVYLSQGLDDQLPIRVALFQPRPGDKTKATVEQDGQWIKQELPPYCIASVEHAKSSMSRYIKNSMMDYLKVIVDRSTGVTRTVLEAAVRYVQQTKSPLVEGALELLAASRIIEWSWTISGSETLGIRDFGTQGSRRVPIPPMMGVQLDQIVIKDFLDGHRDKMLQMLQAKLYGRQKEDLYEIFLTTYILATHIEHLLRHSRHNARKHAVPRRYNSIAQAQVYIQGHNTLLSHFHYFARDTPLAPKARLPKSGGVSSGLSDDQLRFLRGIKEAMAQEQSNFRTIRDAKMYETEMFFAHQLFVDEWQLESEHVADEISIR